MWLLLVHLSIMADQKPVDVAIAFGAKPYVFVSKSECEAVAETVTDRTGKPVECREVQIVSGNKESF